MPWRGASRRTPAPPSSAHPAIPACGTWRRLSAPCGGRPRRAAGLATTAQPDDRRPRSAPGRRRGRSVRRRPGCRSSGPTQAAAAPRDQQDVREGVHDAARRAHRGVPRVRVGRGGVASLLRAIRVPRRGQSRRSCCRQGRCRCPRCRAAPAVTAMMRRNAASGRRATACHRGMARGSRAVVLRLERWRRVRAPRVRTGSQACLRRGRRPEHRWDGCLCAEPALRCRARAPHPR